MSILHSRVTKLESLKGNVGRIFAVTSNGASLAAVETHLSSLPTGFSRGIDQIAHIVLNKSPAFGKIEVWNVMPVRQRRG